MNLFFVVFCLFVLVPNSNNKLITIDIHVTSFFFKATAAYVYEGERLRACLYV